MLTLSLGFRVYNILEHKKESETIVYEDPDPSTGFIIVPDMYACSVCVDFQHLLTPRPLGNGTGKRYRRYTFNV